MGKKAKVGKQRRDKYYQLAKETGYRSRAAFKLIQLNRKFGFLQKSRVLVDLCAAPGGWMQVAKQNMPVSSVVVGVDLFPIKTVPNCISLVEDITTEQCKQSLQRELKTWKADVFLHDGAPNVGQNWLHDAHQQSLLTLAAAKLACQFLRAGGWFISKVFRSKDYNALIWVLKQLFKKVHATKPQASRSESAEIFVVCQGFLAPDKLDARFFDPRHVFEDVELESRKTASTFFHPERQKKAKAEGYPEGAATLHKALPASVLIASDSPVDLLQTTTQVVLDDPRVSSHARTTAEVRACLEDIRVLGRRELRLLVAWCAALKPLFAEPSAEDKSAAPPAQQSDEEEDIDKQLAELKESERREARRQRKTQQKARRKLQDRLDLKMVVKGDDGPRETEADDMFALKTVTTQKVLRHLEDQSPDDPLSEGESEEEGEEGFQSKLEAYRPDKTRLHKSGTFYQREGESESSDGEETKDPLESPFINTKVEEGLGLSDSELSFEEDSEEEDSEDKPARLHPLLTDLDPRSKTDRRKHRANLWFQKEAFGGLDNDAEALEDLELDALASELRSKGGAIMGEKQEEEEEEESVDDSEDAGSEYEMPSVPAKQQATKRTAAATGDKGAGGFEVVPKQTAPGPKRVKLDPEGLALGSLIATSRRRRRDFEDAGWHRNAFNDAEEHLPDWFVEDEKKHCRKEPPVPEELVEELRQRTNHELTVRPIKKVVEAKARKKKRAVKRLEKAKKKVEALMDSSEISSQEKARQIRTLYRKAAGASKKPEVTYVVSKKHTTGKRARRPPGVKGPYKVVDPRLKKDTRGMARARSKKQGGKKAAVSKPRPNKKSGKAGAAAGGRKKRR